MSIPFSQGKLQADERKTILQAVQKQAKAAALKAIRPVLKEFLEAEVTTKVGRAKGVPRQISSTQLRRKFRQAVTFGSRKGAEVAIYLQVQRLHAHWSEEPWWEISHSLYFDLWNLNP
jgi:hypothetical protein